ncbi:MAG: hypothetical protein ACOY3V_09730 [Pseudomonadota bacterium]
MVIFTRQVKWVIVSETQKPQGIPAAFEEIHIHFDYPAAKAAKGDTMQGAWSTVTETYLTGRRGSKRQATQQRAAAGAFA